MEERLPFHRQLKLERERRGWSQADVAAKVDCDTKTVGRWEKGKTLPRPYHRQVLCQIFEKSAGDFGLFKEDNSGLKTSSPPSQINSQQLSRPTPSIREDRAEAPDIINFYGRDKELTTVQQWIQKDRCRVVAILGMGGVGKSVLSAKVVEQVKDTFDCIVWRSLHNAPPLAHIMKHCIQFVSHQQRVDLPKEVDDQISLLVQYLRVHRCLLVLDNVESILQAGRRAGQYREGYESYGRLFQRIGEAQHQSCLLLTSREKPKEVAHLDGKIPPVRSLPLSGVGQAEGRKILQDKGLVGSDQEWAALVHLYSGNPLALKLVSESIQEVFAGDISQFLKEEEIAFGDINDLLEQQFHRLSAQEREILYWLAIERETMSLEDLREGFVHPVSKGALIEALDSLRRRSMIEIKGSAYFTLQPVIMEYVTTSLVKRAYKEFDVETPGSWLNFALIKAQTSDYIRDSQIRLILAPIVQRLLTALGKEGIEQKLRNMLSVQRQVYPLQPNYFAGNALNLLIYMQSDLRGFDFSHLVVLQAYLQHASLVDTNFTHAHFASSIFTGTFGNILSVACSPDGDLLAAGSATGEIWIFHTRSGKLLLTCYGHTDGVWSVVFNPDGRMLVSSSDDQTIRLWDVNTGHCARTLHGHANRVRSAALNADGRMLVSGSDDQTIRLWDIETGLCLKILHGHSDRAWSVTFSPNGSILASSSTDQTIRLWDVNTGQCLKTLHGHSNWVRSVVFSPDGAVLASGSDDQTVRLWNVNTGDCLTILHGHSNRVWSIAFNMDGSILASGGEDQTIRLWDVGTGDCLNTLQGHTQGVRSICFIAGGQILASGGDDQTVRLWNVSSGYCLKSLQGYTTRIWSIAFYQQGDMLASCGEDQNIRLWNLSTGRCLKTLQDHTHGVKTIAIAPEGSLLASAGEDQSIRLWETDTGRRLKTLSGHSNWIRSVAFSLDGLLLASGGEDQSIRLWEVSTGHSLKTLEGHTSWVRSVVFHPDGTTLASGSDDQSIRIWEVSTGRCLYILQGHTGRVRSVAFNADGSLLASGSEDGTIRLWAASGGKWLTSFEGHISWVRSVVFSPRGNLLASSSEDHTIRVWDSDTGRCLNILHGHTNRVRCIIFSPDGRMLVSCSDDGSIKCWDVDMAMCLKTFISERPYERMNITLATGLTAAQKVTLQALGALEKQ
jgi:WD40 repeat protein/transcriptional regulator with XRE-family HTH domain